MTLKVDMSNKKKNEFNTSLTRLLVCPISGGALYYDKNENFMGFGGKCEFDVWMLRSKPKSSQNFFGDDGLKA